MESDLSLEGAMVLKVWVATGKSGFLFKWWLGRSSLFTGWVESTGDVSFSPFASAHPEAGPLLCDSWSWGQALYFSPLRLLQLNTGDCRQCKSLSHNSGVGKAEVKVPSWQCSWVLVNILFPLEFWHRDSKVRGNPCGLYHKGINPILGYGIFMT